MSDAKDKRAEHSPAPWSIAHVQWTTIKRRDQDAEHEANARLIAAAPALLKALRDLVEFGDDNAELGDAPCFEVARKALALVDGDG